MHPTHQAVLAGVWGLSIVYAMMSPQLLSKEVDRPCSVREPLGSPLSLAGLGVGLLLPLALGPGLACLASSVLTLASSCLAVCPAPQPRCGVHNILAVQ